MIGSPVLRRSGKGSGNKAVPKPCPSVRAEGNLVQSEARVLLVTQARSARSGLINGLNRLGWPATATSSAEVALQILAKAKIDVVVIDLIQASKTTLKEAAILGRQLKAALAPKTVMVIALANPEPLAAHKGLDLVMTDPLDPAQLARGLEVMVRLAMAQDEIALRTETFATLGSPLVVPIELQTPYQILMIGQPAPQMLAIYNALIKTGAEVSATFSMAAGFDSLHRMQVDAVILRAANQPEQALSMAAATQRNSAHHHLPISLLLSESPSVDASHALNRGISDLISADTDEGIVANQVLEMAGTYRRIRAAKAALATSRQSDLMDAATGLFTAPLFAIHLFGLNRSAIARGRPLSICVLRISERRDTAKARAQGWLDPVMPQLGAMLTRWVRGEDSVARLGPDIFALALPGTSARSARLAAERVAAVVSCTQFGSGGGQSAFIIEFDIGVAEVAEGESPAKTLERAASGVLQRRTS